MDANTEYGRLIVGERETLFACALQLVASAKTWRDPARAWSWALTGGSTPQEWYRWCVSTGALGKSLLAGCRFTVSDERHVPLASAQSNFGTAERLLLNPLGVPREARHPWPVEQSPADAAAGYAKDWRKFAGEGRAYDVCFLGMGEDGHTASLFPGSPLLQVSGGGLFAAVEVPGKGWRLTITPDGLEACSLIVIMAFGAAKAETLERVFHGSFAPQQVPVQLTRNWQDRVVWFVDDAAAARL